MKSGGIDKENKMQNLQLAIRQISILKGRGADQICFHVPNYQALDRVLGNTEARKIFPELTFDLKITKDKGEDLLAALGLKADEVIDISTEYNFGKPT